MIPSTYPAHLGDRVGHASRYVIHAVANRLGRPITVQFQIEHLHRGDEVGHGVIQLRQVATG
jgi:hypothetical protein